VDLYEQPKPPVICFDESPCQLIDDAIIPMPIKPGSPKKENFEYVRNSTCWIFLAYELCTGKRMICAKERRTKADYADFMKNLANELHYHGKVWMARIADMVMLTGEVSAWEHERNAVGATVNWKFNKCNAR